MLEICWYAFNTGSVSMPAVREGCMRRGTQGPTPPAPTSRQSLAFEANAVASRRAAGWPGRPQGTNPRGLSIPWLACVYSFA